MPDFLTEPLQNLLSFAARAGWIAGVVVALIWITGWFRARARGMVRRRGGDEHLATVIDNVVRIAVYLIIFLLVIGAVTGGIGATVTAIGLITAAVSLSLQDVLRNFVSGIYLLIERPFAVGDTIHVVDQKGAVERIDIRTTVIRNELREEVFIPNFRVFTEVVRRKGSVESQRYWVRSPEPAHAVFDAIWSAARSVQSLPDYTPAVRILSAGTDDTEFEVITWNTVGQGRSDAFIAAVKSNLANSTIRLAPD